MKLKLAGNIVYDSIVDGPGLRATIFVQGCTHNCPGCHNPSTHDLNGGTEVDINDIINDLEKHKKQFSGVTLSGGEPLLQQDKLIPICLWCINNHKDIWLYTGFTYEKVNTLEIMDYIDIVVDGQFIEKYKSYNCLFKGSTNQRIIDVKQSKKLNETFLSIYNDQPTTSVKNKNNIFI